MTTKFSLAVFVLALPLAAQVGPSDSAILVPTGTAFAPATPAALVEHTPVTPTRSEPRGRTLYRWSLAALAASSAADAASSWRMREANPVLASPQSTFGVESAALKLGLVGTCVLLEHFALRHHPEIYRHVAWLNFGITGVQGVVVQHNVSLR
jgi:hypothetical protein